MVDVILLNWNELNVSKDSIRRLLKETEVAHLIVVDNGSTDGSIEYFNNLVHEKLLVVQLLENMGPSVGRNQGIELTTEKYIFLLDGDILYVPGTIAEYTKIIEKYDDAFCVGQNSFEMVVETGHNGTLDPLEADLRMSSEYIVSDWFPMSWTQYGLFRGDLLREYRFLDEGPFGERGWGFEDDDFYHQMKRLGYISLAVNKPIYYHEAHTGVKELIRTESRDFFNQKMKERKKLFEKRWGKGASWIDTLTKEQPKKTTRP